PYPLLPQPHGFEGATPRLRSPPPAARTRYGCERTSAQRDSCLHNEEIGSAMSLRSLSLAAVFALVALVVGCGDDDNGGGGQAQAPSPTKTQQTKTTTQTPTASHGPTI